MNINEYIPLIIQKIYELEKEFQETQGLILTEDDLKSILFSKLMNISDLFVPKATRNQNINATSLHTEISFYDDSGNLSIKPDICILEPEHLSIINFFNEEQLRLPSKQYSFGGKAIIFELKFIRNKQGITTYDFRSQVKKDFLKIQRLLRKLEREGFPNDIFCFFIIFNKTNQVCYEFKEFLEVNKDQRYKIIYASGMVDF